MALVNQLHPILSPFVIAVLQRPVRGYDMDSELYAAVNLSDG